MTITDDIKDEHLNKSLLCYKARRADGTWTEEQEIDLDPYFGDWDGWFDDKHPGYSKKSKNEKIDREYTGSPFHEELKLKAELLMNNGEYREPPQGIFLYPYFDLIDGTLQYKGPIRANE
ncbi:hypothetical protein Asppvi_010126 [Aspergillus pseudoviridinutans]|uniref:Uncharacterized protein n=1 Tax=Aspergillus pseudoviridinutans TaxID=1517512 RepID=A0A9P3BP01_9EURO|nr:uncharacterized protein Asppvi_010126 [Aspergillus pseudoviridinutans]GIJ91161.1 hypothetical protein Asppvi_010126 [Aspergillus pseudoviridinutans]